jgi:hypothetical protein
MNAHNNYPRDFESSNSEELYLELLSQNDLALETVYVSYYGRMQDAQTGYDDFVEDVTQRRRQGGSFRISEFTHATRLAEEAILPAAQELNVRLTGILTSAEQLHEFLEPSDRDIWRKAIYIADNYGLNSQSVDSLIKRASSPTAQGIMNAALDGRRWIAAQRIADNKGVNSQSVDSLIKRASSPTAQAVMNAALDGRRWIAAQTLITTLGVSSEAVGLLIKRASSPTAQAVMNAALDGRRWIAAQRLVDNGVNSQSVDSLIRRASSPAVEEILRAMASHRAKPASRTDSGTRNPSEKGYDSYFSSEDFYNSMFNTSGAYRGSGNRPPTHNTQPGHTNASPRPRAEAPAPLSPQELIDQEIESMRQQGVPTNKIRAHMARKYHPDTNPGSGELFQYVNEKLG